MSDRSKVDAVASGAPYVVTAVNDRPPQSLDDFVERSVVAVTVASEHQVVEIHGSARIDGDSVIIHEKDHDGIGKDVRTWLIGSCDGHFEATERSLF